MLNKPFKKLTKHILVQVLVFHTLSCLFVLHRAGCLVSIYLFLRIPKMGKRRWKSLSIPPRWMDSRLEHETRPAGHLSEFIEKFMAKIVPVSLQAFLKLCRNNKTQHVL